LKSDHFRSFPTSFNSIPTSVATPAAGPQANPFDKVLTELNVDGQTYRYYSLPSLKDDRLATLPYSIRILLEAGELLLLVFLLLEEEEEVPIWREGTE